MPPTIYAFPFIIVAGMAAMLCVIVPGWRTYVLHALTLPVAFGLASLGGGLGALVLAATFLPGLNELMLISIIALGYIASGCGGVYVAKRIADWLMSKPVHHSRDATRPKT